MAELWQTYGAWILYAAFFFAMLWMHGFMRGGRGRQAGHHHPHGDGAEGSSGGAEAASPTPAADGAPRADRGTKSRGHNHRGGCC